MLVACAVTAMFGITITCADANPEKLYRKLKLQGSNIRQSQFQASQQQQVALQPNPAAEHGIWPTSSLWAQLLRRPPNMDYGYGYVPPGPTNSRRFSNNSRHRSSPRRILRRRRIRGRSHSLFWLVGSASRTILIASPGMVRGADPTRILRCQIPSSPGRNSSDGELKILRRVSCRHLHANTARSPAAPPETKTRSRKSQAPAIVRPSVRRQRGIAQHDRHNRMHPRHDVETCRRHRGMRNCLVFNSSRSRSSVDADSNSIDLSAAPTTTGGSEFENR